MVRRIYPRSIDAFIISVVVIRGSGMASEVLLLRRTHPPVGAWCQIAGKIEEHETAWQAALREMREETSLIPDALYSADTLEQFYEAEHDAITVAPVFVAKVDHAAQVTLNEEHDDFRWLPFDGAIDLVSFGGQRRILRDIQAEFVDRPPSEHLLIKT